MTSECGPGSHSPEQECPCNAACGCCQVVVASKRISPRLAEAKAFWYRLMVRRGRQKP